MDLQTLRQDVTVDSLQGFDLLRRRRQELGIELVKPVPTRTLLLRGSLIAGALAGLGLAVWLGMLTYVRVLQSRLEQLQPIGAQFQVDQARLQRLMQEVQTMANGNQELANAIAAIPSSSLLLGELADLTPKSIQITSAVQQGNQLTLNGLASRRNGLRAINALQLALENTPLFLRHQVRVVKIIEQVATQAAAVAAPAAGGAVADAVQGLTFEIKAGFSPIRAATLLPRLQAQGSLGLMRRLRVLQREGLLP